MSYSYSMSYSTDPEPDFECPVDDGSTCVKAGQWAICECVAWEATFANGVTPPSTCEGTDCAAAIKNVNAKCKAEEPFSYINMDAQEVVEMEGGFDPLLWELLIKDAPQPIPLCENLVEAPPTLEIKVPVTLTMDIEVPTTDQFADEAYIGKFVAGVTKGIKDAMATQIDGAFEIVITSIAGNKVGPDSRRLAADVDIKFDVVKLVTCVGDCDTYLAAEGTNFANAITTEITAAVATADVGAAIVAGLAAEDITIPAVVVKTVAVIEAPVVEVNEPETVVTTDAPTVTPATDAPTVTPATGAPSAEEEVDGAASAIKAGASAIAVVVAAVAMF